jgi:hypothetical protein
VNSLACSPCRFRPRRPMKPGFYRLAQPLSGAPSSSHFLISESVAARIRAGDSTKALPAPNRSIPGPPGHARRMQLGWVAAGGVSSYCEPSHILSHHQRSPSSIRIRSSAATRHQGCPLGRVRPGRVDESSTGLGLRRDLGEKKEESSLGARHVFAAVLSPGGGRIRSPGEPCRPSMLSRDISAREAWCVCTCCCAGGHSSPPLLVSSSSFAAV